MTAKVKNRIGISIRDFTPLDWLLFAVPMAFALRFIPAWKNDTWLFFASALAIIPLAGWMSRATEHLGERIGPGISGLLNATFSNATELIIAMMALSQGLIGVVKASIIGSILGNILVVLGLSMLAGGLRFPHLRFNQTAIRAAATSLTLATIGLIIPTIFRSSVTEHGNLFPQTERELSLAIATVLLGTYICWLVFSLVTHKALFAGRVAERLELSDEQHPVWPLNKALTILALATLLVALMSEFLAGSVENACKNLGLTEIFVGVVIVSVIGNAGETTAVLVALKNKMDLSLSIAIGSSLQIALFVTPLLVFTSYLLGTPITLEFTLPEIASMVLAVGLVVLISGDGECNWIEGVQLLSVYLILALLFFFLPQPVESRENTSLELPIQRSAQ